jgi:hypothetical protein
MGDSGESGQVKNVLTFLLKLPIIPHGHKGFICRKVRQNSEGCAVTELLLLMATVNTGD